MKKLDKKALIVAPHCDDEILGCGGIMAKYQAEGILVFVAIVTNGHLGAPELFKKEGTEKVRQEALSAHQFLGVQQTYFLDFPALRLDSIPAYKLSLELEKIIREHQISDLFIPHRGDIHKDHRITFEASLVAARPINDNPVRRILAYETLSETEWAPPYSDDAFIPNIFENIESYIESKKKAFRFFTTQVKQFPHPRSEEVIEYLSKFRGSTVGYSSAEAFMLIREKYN
ncbi:MAG: PIG-L family deacetylase [Mameliella sp.]|nr:PIG-L family deacetylase [Phaeodactylibacter sp.]